MSTVYTYTPVDRGLHSNPSEEFEDPAISKVKLELSDVYKNNKKIYTVRKKKHQITISQISIIKMPTQRIIIYPSVKSNLSTLFYLLQACIHDTMYLNQKDIYM